MFASTLWVSNLYIFNNVCHVSTLGPQSEYARKFNLHEFDTKKLTISNHNTIPSPRNSYKIKASRDNKTKTKGISDLWFASSSNNIDKFSLLFERIRKYPLSNHFSSYYHTQHINLDLDFKYYRYFDFELLRRIKKSKE